MRGLWELQKIMGILINYGNFEKLWELQKLWQL
jgi:hypothetical protein